MLEQVHLDLDFSQVLSADYDSHRYTCIEHQRAELSDIHEQFGGFPDSYCFENTEINQIWWGADDLDFAEIGRQLGMEVVTVSTIRQPPGCVIPYHRDTFYRIKTTHPDRTDVCVRANIHLTDYALGHFIQYTDRGVHRIWSDWCVGDGLLWDSSVLHLGANAGMTHKYTMQVSGFYSKEMG